MGEPAKLYLPSISEIRASLARDCLKDFTHEAWPLVELETPLSWNWHLDLFCEELEAVTRGEVKRLIANVPPGTMKSLMFSVFWPAWEWATNPGLRYLTASYSDANTIRDNRRLRTVIQSEWYQRHFPARLASDQWAKVRFDTEQGGWRIATSVGGMGTGEHPDRILIDDPLKALDARSEKAIAACTEWISGTISTRLARNPAILIVMQRLNEKDPSGFQLNKGGGWRHLLLPMRYEAPPRNGKDRSGRWDCPCHQGGPDPRDPRTEPGELLWPEVWPEEMVREEEIDLGPYGAAGQLQQRPAPDHGGFFDRDSFQIVEAAPVEARRCRGWDTAATKGGGDHTAGVKLAVTAEGIIYVEHAIRVRVEDAERVIVQTAELDGKECAIREEQEPGASGKVVIKAHSRALAGYDYAGVTISGDKVTRARPFRAQSEAGNVRIVRGTWNAAYLDELAVFPVGAHDDQVDGSSCAYNDLAGGPAPRKVSLTWGT